MLPSRLLTIILVVVGVVFLNASVGTVATVGVCLIALALHLNCSAVEMKEEQHYKELQESNNNA